LALLLRISALPLHPLGLRALPLEISASPINPFALRALPLGREEIAGSKSNSVMCENFLPF